MAKSVRAGEMRTAVEFYTVEHGINANGFPTETEKALFPGPVACKWVTAHGSEAMENMRLNLEQTATLTTRYMPKITVQSRCRRKDDPAGQEWEIVNLNDVEGRHKTLEIYVRRVVKA